MALATVAAAGVSEVVSDDDTKSTVSQIIDQIINPELVTDGTFDETGTWTGNAYNVANGRNEANVETAGNAYDVNLSGTVDLEAGENYTLKFDVSGTAGRTLVAGIGQSSGDYLNHTKTVTVNDGTQTIILHLKASADGTGADFGGDTSRVLFDMGAATGAVNIDNVSLKKGHNDTESLGSYTDPNPNLVTDGTFDDTGTWTGNAYNVANGRNEANVQSAGNAYDVNLSGTVTLEEGANYTLQFDVSGTAGRTLIAGIGQSSGDYLNHTKTVTINDGTQTVILHLTASADGSGTNFGDATSRVLFDMGAATGAVNIDNVILKAGHLGTESLGSYTAPSDDPTSAAPTSIPQSAEDIYIDSVGSIVSTLDPNWGQATDLQEVDLGSPAGDMLKFSSTNFQGIDLNATDVSSYAKVTMDVWSGDAGKLKFFLISDAGGSNTQEFGIIKDVTADSWNTLEFTLTDFTGVDTTNVNQLKFDNQSTAGGVGVGETGLSTFFVDNFAFIS